MGLKKVEGHSIREARLKGEKGDPDLHFKSHGE